MHKTVQRDNFKLELCDSFTVSFKRSAVMTRESPMLAILTAILTAFLI